MGWDGRKSLGGAMLRAPSVLIIHVKKVSTLVSMEGEEEVALKYYSERKTFHQ